MTVAGIDIGHSAVKLAFKTPDGTLKHRQYPSVVTPAIPLSFDPQPEVTHGDTVEVMGRRYFVGLTAVSQGAQAASGLSMDWINTPEHVVLMERAQRHLVSHQVMPELVVLGLPVVTFAQQQEALSLQGLEIFKTDVVVVPQPWGAYQHGILNEKGEHLTSKGTLLASWAVIDVGHFTTDFMLMEKGRWIEFASGSCGGIYKAVEQLKKLLHARGLQTSQLECEEALRTGFIRNFNDRLSVQAEIEEAVAVVVNEIIDTGTRLFGGVVRRLDAVLLAGGGADIIFPTLKERWPHTMTSDDPRMAIAEGMRRWGLTRLSRK